MDLRLQEYIVAIEKYGNITEAARKLFVTPSALNQQLIKLEKELDIPLFIRNKRKMLPSPAGRIYIDTAKQILRLKQTAYSTIKDLSGCLTGTYRIGLTFDHGNKLFTSIFPAFHKLYPNIQIRCFQVLVPEMIQMLNNEQLDLIFILSGETSKYENDLNYIPISQEPLVMGLPKKHPLVKDLPPSTKPYGTMDLHLVCNDSFAMALKTTTMRRELISPIFQDAGIAPNIMIESSQNGFLEQVVTSGICNCIIPQSQVKDWTNIAWFYLPGCPIFRFGAAYIKGYYLNIALKTFIVMAQEYAAQMLNIPLPTIKERNKNWHLDRKIKKQ